MSRPKKYSSPEIAGVARDYKLLLRNHNIQARIFALLGNKCSICGNENTNALLVPGGVPANWAKRLKDVENFPTMFSLSCANCNREAVSTAALKRLDELHGILYAEEVRASKERALEDAAKEAKQEAKEQAEREYTLRQAEALRATQARRAAEIEAQIKERQEEDERYANEEARRHGFGQPEINETPATHAIA